MNKFTICLYFLALSCVCVNYAQTAQTYQECGEYLYELLREKCRNGYHDPMGKKSIVDTSRKEIFSGGRGEQVLSADDLLNCNHAECENLMLMDAFSNVNKREREILGQRKLAEENAFENKVSLGPSFITRSDAWDFGRFTRQRRFIVKECCHKECLEDELLSYCQPMRG